VTFGPRSFITASLRRPMYGIVLSAACIQSICLRCRRRQPLKLLPTVAQLLKPNAAVARLLPAGTETS
jgi:hypothetical protein